MEHRMFGPIIGHTNYPMQLRIVMSNNFGKIVAHDYPMQLRIVMSNNFTKN